MQSVWRSIRGPFYTIQCLRDDHQWERFHSDQAGCLLCGSIHQCSASVSLNHENCPLSVRADGHASCTITGLLIPSLCTSTEEYLPHTRFDALSGAGETPYDRLEKLSNDVTYILSNFLFHRKMAMCKAKENKKKLHKFNINLVKHLKSFKASHPLTLPNLPTIITQTLYETPHLVLSHMPTQAHLDTAARFITKCLHELGEPPGSRQSMVIGLLYLMKSGLIMNNCYWLPKFEDLNYCLPHENSLEKFFGISIKIICETENEVKLLLRQKSKTL